MKFRKVLDYDASPDEVFAMLRDETFRSSVCDAQEVVSHTVTITPDGEGFSLAMNQEQNTAGLPSIAKKIVGDTTQTVIEEDWKGRTGGSMSITTPGKPTQASGTIRLEPHGAGTHEVVELEVKVKVPLIAGKLESLMAEQIERGYDVEYVVGQAWLRGEK